MNHLSSKMAFTAFIVCILTCILLSHSIAAINPHIIIRNTKNMDPINHKSLQENMPRNLTIDRETYIFSGKVLRSFYPPNRSNIMDRKSFYFFPEDLLHTNYLVSVVKIMRIYKGNDSIVKPLMRVIVISQKPIICRKKLVQLTSNHQRCIQLIFSKMLSSFVFKADFILTEKGHKENDVPNNDTSFRSSKFKRTRKGKKLFIYKYV